MQRRQGRRGRRGRRLLAAGSAALALSAVSGCGAGTSGPPAEVSGGTGAFHGTDVSDVIPRPPLALVDTRGTIFALQQRPADELTVLFYGYTRCPDICPTTMADLAAARRQLSARDRGHLEVVFVTEDPATDTAPVMRRWLDAFDPSFIGLVGGDPATEATLDALKAPRTVITATAPPGVRAPLSGPVVQHAGSVYVFHGSQVLVYTDRTSPRDYAADWRALLAA